MLIYFEGMCVVFGVVLDYKLVGMCVFYKSLKVLLVLLVINVGLCWLVCGIFWWLGKVVYEVLLLLFVDLLFKVMFGEFEMMLELVCDWLLDEGFVV